MKSIFYFNDMGGLTEYIASYVQDEYMDKIFANKKNK